MIYQVSGDILLSKAKVLAHGAALNDPMKQGLALAFHRKYPTMRSPSLMQPAAPGCRIRVDVGRAGRRAHRQLVGAER